MSWVIAGNGGLPGPPAANAIRPAGKHYDYDVQSKVAALYGQIEQPFAERFRLTAGARVEYVDKAEALRRYRAGFPATAELSDELGTNPLPASLELVLAPGGGAMERRG